jgi:serine protease AprX
MSVHRIRSSRSRQRRRRVMVTGALLTLGTTLAAHMASAVSTPIPSVALGYDAAQDGGSLSLITRLTGAQAMWDTGMTGRGVDVALIDTGVAPVAGLSRTGKVVYGPDLSFDAQSGLPANIDANGHGTHMASIIAGTDLDVGATATRCTTCLGRSPYSDTTKFVGVAPDSRIVSVKAGAVDGAVDVTQVIAAINWVVEHRRDNGMNIRVLNLSYGTDSTQNPMTDPLAFAVESAWRAGIVVVVAAGNDGIASPALSNPALDPAVIAVGSIDTNNTLDAKDDTVPTYAQHGNASRPVDVLAPGSHVIGLRVPGSAVDTSTTTGKVGTRFQRGSGTSQSAAVVSGLAALLVQRYPTATPDQIKMLLTKSAVKLYHVNKTVKGLGLSTAAAESWSEGNGVANVSKLVKPKSLPTSAPQALVATGSGSIELSRGTAHLTSGTAVLEGEFDIFGLPFDSAAWAKGTTSGTTWTGGTWNGARWTGDGWLDGQWAGARWTATDWAGARWTGARWTGTAWDGARWTGARWTGARWTGARWTDSAWAGARWSGASWA